MSRIFISHSARDAFATVAIGDWLEREGWNDVYLDVDPDRGTHAGQRWQRALYDHASDCEAVLFLVSANWLNSEWCRREYDLARKLNKKVFIVLIDETTVNDLPTTLKETHQAVSLATGEDHDVFQVALPITHEQGQVTFSKEGLRRLKNGLVQAGLDPRFFSWPPANEPDRVPYRGLDPLDEVDAGIFFGREAPIIEVLDIVRGLREGASPRLLVVLGASGAGKSSFLRAGILPRLARDGLNFFVLPVIRPGRAVLSGGNGLIAALTLALGKHGSGVTRVQVRDAVKQGGEKTRELLRVFLGDRHMDWMNPPTLVIAVDQAEELFRPEGSEEAERFLALLRAFVCQDDPAIVILFSIRTDSYDTLERAKALEGLRQHTYALLPMPRGAYQTVIEGPARRLEEAGRKFQIDPSLTQALLTDIEKGEGSDALPLLALTLQQLYYDHAAATRISKKDFDKGEGLKGAIDAAVARVFEAADGDGRIPRERGQRLERLRRGLIPWLAGIDPETKTVRRRTARASQIPEDARPLIDLLVQKRLLTLGKDEKTGEATIEPTHEALLRQWDLLAGWLGEDSELLTTLEAVRRAARDWEANSRAEAWLLHQGPRLAGAQVLYTRVDLAPSLDKNDRSYLAACQAKEEMARSKEEAHWKAREEEQTRRLRDARRLAWRTGVGALMASAFAFLFAGSSYFFFKARNTAEDNLKAAKQAIAGLDNFIWSANQGAQMMGSAKLSDVQKSLGDLQTTLSNLSASAPADLDLLALRADNSANFVDAYLTAHSLKSANVAASEAKAIAKQMTALAETDPRSLTASIKAAYKTGDVRKQALDLKSAVEECREAVRLAGNLATISPADGSALRLQWIAMDKLGEALFASRDTGARSTLEEATSLARSILDADAVPEHRRSHVRDLAISISNEGRFALSAGEYPRAIALFHSSLDLFRKLLAEIPADPLFARDEMLALVGLGQSEHSTGDTADANEDLNQALSIANRLEATDPLDARSKHDVLAVLETRAQTELESDKGAAQKDLDEGVAIARNFVELDRNSARSRFELATILMQLALNFGNDHHEWDEANNIIVGLRGEGLITPAESATVAQFEQLMRAQ